MLELLLVAGVGLQVEGWSSAKVQKYYDDAVHSSVQVYSNGPVSGSDVRPLGTVVLFSDDFEDGNADGWNLVDGNGDGKTFAATQCSNIHQPPTNCGTYALNYDDDDAGGSAPPSLERAISPVIDLSSISGATAVTLSYDYGFDSYDQDDTARVYIATFSSGAWADTNVVMEQPLTTTNDSGFVSYDITSLVSGAESLVVILEYVDGGGWNWNVAFDNITVSAEVPVPNDLSVVSIILPELDFYTFYPAGSGPAWPVSGDVGVVVANTGDSVQTNFDLILEVNGNPYTVSGLSLDTGQVDTVLFSAVDIDSISTFVAYHSLTPDDLPGNDTLTVTHNFITYKVGDTITYADTMDAVTAIGANSSLGPTRIAVKFDSSDLYLFTGKYIKAVFFYHCAPGGTCTSGGNNAIAIYPDNSGVPDHQNPIFRKEVGDVGTTPGLMFFTIDTIAAADLASLTIGTFPFYVARELENLASGYPLGAENGCTAGKGCWVSADSLNGGAWAQLSDYGLNYDWILGMVVSDTADYVGAGESIIVPGDAKLVRSVVNGYLILNAPANEDMTIEMYNTAGKLVRKVLVRKGSDRTFVGKLPTGAYFYINDKGKAGSLIVR